MGALGNMRPNNIVGPTSWQLDMAVSRNFQVTEGQSLEFRGEAFNLTNSLRAGNPQMNFRNSRFGQITSSRDARIMQFVLKYVFKSELAADGAYDADATSAPSAAGDSQ